MYLSDGFKSAFAVRAILEGERVEIGGFGKQSLPYIRIQLRCWIRSFPWQSERPEVFIQDRLRE